MLLSVLSPLGGLCSLSKCLPGDSSAPDILSLVSQNFSGHNLLSQVNRGRFSSWELYPLIMAKKFFINHLPISTFFPRQRIK